MQKTIKDTHEYYEVYTKVWAYFRKYYKDYDADAALQGAEDFSDWLKFKGPRMYEFGMALIKIAWKEVGELHEMRKENEQIKTS